MEINIQVLMTSNIPKIITMDNSSIINNQEINRQINLKFKTQRTLIKPSHQLIPRITDKEEDNLTSNIIMTILNSITRIITEDMHQEVQNMLLGISSIMEVTHKLTVVLILNKYRMEFRETGRDNLINNQDNEVNYHL